MLARMDETKRRELFEWLGCEPEDTIIIETGDAEIGEVILTMLGEATTTEISKARDSKGFPSLKKDTKDGGNVSGNARKSSSTSFAPLFPK